MDRKNSKMSLQNVKDIARKEGMDFVSYFKMVQDLYICAKNKYGRINSKFFDFATGGKLKKELKVIKTEIENLSNPLHHYYRLGVDPITVQIGKNLIAFAIADAGGEFPLHLTAWRRHMVDTFGFILPNVKIMYNDSLEGNDYHIYLRDNLVSEGVVYIDYIAAGSDNIDAICKDKSTLISVLTYDAFIPLIESLTDIVLDNADKIITVRELICYTSHAFLLLTADKASCRDEKQKEMITYYNESLMSSSVLEMGKISDVLYALLRDRYPIKDIVSIYQTTLAAPEDTSAAEIAKLLKKCLKKNKNYYYRANRSYFV